MFNSRTRLMVAITTIQLGTINDSETLIIDFKRDKNENQ